MMSTDGGAPFRFDAVVSLDAGANTVVVQATDGNSDVATKTYSVTTTGTSTTYQYDAKGNLRYEKQPDGTVIREYRWDQQNRLVTAIIGTHESDYSYDGASRRVRIQEKESGTQTKDEAFLWCGGQICQKRSGATIERSYFGIGFQEGTNNYVYTRDHLGSLREVVGSDGATIASRLSYDPWGKVTETGSGALSDFTYTGHYADRATGLNLAQYRAYDSLLQRWISRDPLGIVGGLNVYRYTNNNPVRFFDPSGRLPMDGATTDHTVGAHQDWSDSDFQDAYVTGGISGAALDVAVVAPGFAAMGEFTVESSIELWGALQEMGWVGRAITILGGGPVSAVNLVKSTTPTALPGQLTGGAGDCVQKTKDSIATFGGAPINPGWPHWANDLGNGMVHDPTLRGNLIERGAYVGDIPDEQTFFGMAEWMRLAARGNK